MMHYYIDIMWMER